MSQSQAGALATEEVRLNRRRPVLLGTFLGDTPRALIKMPSGRTHIITKGTVVNGDTLVAIDKDRIGFQGDGRVRWLTLP